MVVLRAFIESEYSCGWFPIWQGDSLRDLPKEDFDYFKRFYGLSSLSLRHFFYFFFDEDEFFEDDF